MTRERVRTHTSLQLDVTGRRPVGVRSGGVCEHIHEDIDVDARCRMNNRDQRVLCAHSLGAAGQRAHSQMITI